MLKEVIFPKPEEVEVIAQKFISKNPKITKEKAKELAKIELTGVLPDTFSVKYKKVD